MVPKPTDIEQKVEYSIAVGKGFKYSKQKDLYELLSVSLIYCIFFNR